jgi:hypothetical protein
VGYEDGFGALEVGVGGHDSFACALGKVDEGFAPCGEASEGVVDGGADEEAHVGGDLFVAAAAGVELEGERTDLFGEFEFDEVVDVFGLFVGGDVLESGYGAEALLHLEEFFAGEDSSSLNGAGVSNARFDFIGEEAPVEGEGPLPFFELLVEWFAEASGPHLAWVRFVGHGRCGFSLLLRWRHQWQLA